MTATDFVIRMIDALEKLDVHYMAVGSFSSNVYGRPRSTKDADFVIKLGSTPINSIARELGGDFYLDPQMTFETVTSTMRYRFRHRATAFTIEVFLLSNDAHDQARFARRVQGGIDERRAFVPTAEDVIIQKLRWSKHGRRQKDVEDVRGILAVQQGHLDLDYIRQWCDQHATRDLFEPLLVEASKYAPEI